MIVVNRTYHIQLSPQVLLEDTLNNGNCIPGTAVSKEIVFRKGKEFYLQSHSSGVGVAHPRRYHIIYDESNFR